MAINHIENGKRTDILHTYSDEIIDDDWSVRSQINTGELATRLGALQGFDNRGRQMWTDNFESAKLKWNTTVVGATISLDDNYVLTGSQSLLCAMPHANSSALIYKNIYSPLTGIYGIEMAWSCNKTNLYSLKYGIYLYDGIYKWEYTLNLLGPTRRFVIPVHGLSDEPIGTMTCELDDPHFWHKWKIVADTNNGIISRIMVDGIQYNPTEYEIKHTADASAPHIYLFQEITSLTPATAINVYTDNVIITHLE